MLERRDGPAADRVRRRRPVGCADDHSRVAAGGRVSASLRLVWGGLAAVGGEVLGHGAEALLELGVDRQGASFGMG